MPRRKNAEGVTSALLQVQKQAQALLISLRKEILAKERELLHLNTFNGLYKITRHNCCTGASLSTMVAPAQVARRRAQAPRRC